MKDIIFTEYTSNIANQYRDYLELKYAVEELDIFVKFYIDNYGFKRIKERLDAGLVNDNTFWIPLQSSFKSIIMMYARIFDSTPDRRKVKIDMQGFTNEGQEYHAHLINVRNKFVAHAGTSTYEKVEFNIGITTDGHLVTNSDPIMFKVFGAGQGEFEEKLLPLLKEVENKIAKKNQKARSEFTRGDK